MVSKRVESLLNQLRTQGIVDERVLEAIAQVPREKFVDEAFEHKAWENTALPIGQWANHLAALYGGADDGASGTDAGLKGAGNWHWLRLSDGDPAHLVHHVCSVERIKSLQWQARRRLKQLDLHNVSTRHGDGWQGWQARAPFDAIIVTAAPPEIPAALMAQLDEGGVLVLPVGEEHQYLKRIQPPRRRIFHRYRRSRSLCSARQRGTGLNPDYSSFFCLSLGVGWTHFSVSPPGAAR